MPKYKVYTDVYYHGKKLGHTRLFSHGYNAKNLQETAKHFGEIAKMQSDKDYTVKIAKIKRK